MSVSSDYQYFLQLKQASDSPSRRAQYERSNRKGDFERIVKSRHTISPTPSPHVSAGLHHDHGNTVPSQTSADARDEYGRKKHGCCR